MIIINSPEDEWEKLEPLFSANGTNVCKISSELGTSLIIYKIYHICFETENSDTLNDKVT